MPLNEKVVNKGLSGEELKRLIEHDVIHKLLPNEGLLSPYVSFGRFGYTITLKLHLDQPELRDYPPITVKGGESVPLVGPSEKAEVAAHTLTRTIDSPNAERVRVGIPIPITKKGLDGTIQQEMVTYPPQPELGDGNVKLDMDESTVELKKEWGL